MSSLPIIIISQTESRRKPLEDSLMDLEGFEVHIQQGVLGKDVISNRDIVDLDAFRFLNNREMLPGEAGCAVAHHRAYEKFLKFNSEWSLILEDNSRVFPRELLMLPSLVAELNNFHELEGEPVIVHLFLNNATLIGKRIKLKEDLELYEAFTVLRLAKAYLINKQAASLAVKHGLPIKDVADWPHWVSEVRFLVQIRDLVCIDRDLPSEIGTRIDMTSIRRKFFVTRMLLKFRAIARFIFCIEAVSYRRKTGMKDYFVWIVCDRIYRFLARILGVRDRDNPNVILLEGLLVNTIRIAITAPYLLKVTHSK